MKKGVDDNARPRPISRLTAKAAQLSLATREIRSSMVGKASVPFHFCRLS
jgi:hypothetical protein